MSLIPVGPCHRCKCEISISEELGGQHSSNVNFVCAYDHEAVFREGPTEFASAMPP
jgi:hypothetical protein